MAKTSGLGATILVDDAVPASQDISNDVTEFSLATPRAVQDVTGVDKLAHERLQLLADASVSLKGVFNNASDKSNMVLSTISSTTVARAVKVTPTSQTTPYLGFNAYFSSYDVARSATGELTWSSEGALADGATPDLDQLLMGGFEAPATTYRLDFSETPYAGLEVTVAAGTVGSMLDLEDLADSGEHRPMFRAFATLLKSWNVTSEGEAVPATYEGILTLEPAFVEMVITVWQKNVTSAPPPLNGSSPSGANSPEAALAAASRSAGPPS